jgi:hypothetical protein
VEWTQDGDLIEEWLTSKKKGIQRFNEIRESDPNRSVYLKEYSIGNSVTTISKGMACKILSGKGFAKKIETILKYESEEY